MKKIFIITGFLFSILLQVSAQNKPWKFAHVTDTHVGSETGAEDLKRTVHDINNNPELEFVILTGDVTEFGADKELRLSKSILKKLNKPWYIVPGNHDMCWSESGGNSFRTVFGSETFSFKHNGILFLGTNCGPNMRMSPGQIPRENIVWLDSVLKATPKSTPIIFVNHYPQDSSLNNWYESIDRLKTHNTQLILCGHGHNNHLLNFEGIPGVMGRSNLRAKDSVGGYNIVTITKDSVFYNERKPGMDTNPNAWTTVGLYPRNFTTLDKYPRPNFEVNEKYPGTKEVWSLQDDSDIGSGTVISGQHVIVTNTDGWIKAYDVNNGNKVWSIKTSGKIYSTPDATGNSIVVASTDKYLYCLNNTTGKINWKAASHKPVVASPVIDGDKVFCGSSDGHFRCYNLHTGKLLWKFKKVKGFTESKPVVKDGKVYFGSWGNSFYALDKNTGTLIWRWDDGYTNRMFSPASCVPVITGNKLFIVAPDRYMTCLDATTGVVIWRKGDPKIRVRESMGLSSDSSLVYVKTMDGDVLGISTQVNEMDVKWKSSKNMGYEISPSLVQEYDDLVFGLSNSGNIYAFNRKDGSLAWIHKLSNALVNPLSFLKDKRLIATTMDGKITCLKF